MLNATLSTGGKLVVRNGYLLQRAMQAGICDIEIKAPKVRRA